MRQEGGPPHRLDHWAWAEEVGLRPQSPWCRRHGLGEGALRQGDGTGLAG